MPQADPVDSSPECSAALAAALVKACAQGDLRTALAVLRAGADPGAGLSQPSPLGIVCKRADVRLVKLLLSKGADANALVYPIERWTITPLVIALSECANSCVKTLLENGADPNIICKDFSCKNDPAEHCTPLLIAEVTGNNPAKRLLLAHGADPTLASRLSLSTYTFRPIWNVRAKFFCPVHRVLKHISAGRKIDVIEAALARVPDLNADGADLLESACRHRRADVVLLLLELGANPNPSWRLSLAEADDGTGAIAKLLLSYGYDITWQRACIPLVDACRHGRVDLVELLLAHGASPDVVPQLDDEDLSRTRTPLIEATIFRHLPCVNALLRGGAHPDLASGGFASLEEYMGVSEDQDTCFTMREMNWERPQTNSLSPITVACATGFEEAVESLIHHGASALVADRNGKLPQDYLSLLRDEAMQNRIAAKLKRRLHGWGEPLF